MPRRWSRASGPLLGEIDLTECMVVLSREISKATESNDPSLLEGILIAQTVMLNALFNQLFQKASNTSISIMIGKCGSHSRRRPSAGPRSRRSRYRRILRCSHVGKHRAGSAASEQHDVPRARGLSESAPNELWETHGDRWSPQRRFRQAGSHPAVVSVEKVNGTSNTVRGKARSARNADRGGQRQRFRQCRQTAERRIARSKSGAAL